MCKGWADLCMIPILIHMLPTQTPFIIFLMKHNHAFWNQHTLIEFAQSSAIFCTSSDLSRLPLISLCKFYTEKKIFTNVKVYTDFKINVFSFFNHCCFFPPPQFKTCSDPIVSQLNLRRWVCLEKASLKRYHLSWHQSDEAYEGHRKNTKQIKHL